MKGENKIAPHILNASASLLGFSFVLLTTLRALRLPNSTYIYEFAGIAVGIFVLSSIFSFLAIRTADNSRSDAYETIADYVFLSGLLLLVAMAALIELKFL